LRTFNKLKLHISAITTLMLIFNSHSTFSLTCEKEKLTENIIIYKQVIEPIQKLSNTTQTSPTAIPIKILTEEEKFIQGEHSDIKKIIWDNSRKNNLDPNYVLGICLIETGGTLIPNVIGPKTYCGRARGIMQLMPELLKIYDVEDPYDPEQSIKAGTRHLKYLMELYKNKKIYDENENLLKTEYVAAIAYNWGEDGVAKMLKKYDCIIIENLPFESRRYLKITRAHLRGEHELVKKLIG
jgi:soluble lytic murein transglycosylase-like protein